MDESVAPKQIRLESSSYCQLRCPSCPTTTGAIHPAIGSGFLDPDDFATLLRDSPGLESVELSNYGEIFLNPQLPRILRTAFEAGVSTTAYNGVNLNFARPDALEAVVKYGLRTITCSIDGATAAAYQMYRVRGDFENVLANIRTINLFKEQFGSRYPELVWQFVVFGHNQHEISAARSLATDLGMSFRLKLNWDESFSPIRDREQLLNELGSEVATRAEHVEKYGTDYVEHICLDLWDSPQINWDGKVLGCCRNYWGDFGSNAFAEGLPAALNSEGMHYARRMLQGLEEPRKDIPCSTCDIYLTRARFQTWVTR